MAKKTAPKFTPKPAPVAVKATKPEPDAAAAFLREVDEAMQAEKLQRFWQTNKWFLAGAIVAVLLIVAGYQGYQRYADHQQRALAARWYTYTTLTAQPEREKELAAIATEAKGGYAALAGFTQAEAAATPKEKSALYDKAAANTSMPQWLRDVAAFNAAVSLLGTDDTAAQSKLELLTQGNPNDAGPAYALAMEQLAILAQRQGKSSVARGYAEKLLAMPVLTPDLRQRTLQRLGLLSTLAN